MTSSLSSDNYSYAVDVASNFTQICCVASVTACTIDKQEVALESS